MPLRSEEKVVADVMERSLKDTSGGAARPRRASARQVARMPCRRLRGSLSEAGQGNTAPVVAAASTALKSPSSGAAARQVGAGVGA